MKSNIIILRILSLSMCSMTLNMTYCMDRGGQWQNAPQYSNVIQITNAVAVDTYDEIIQVNAIPVDTHVIISQIELVAIRQLPEVISAVIPEPDDQDESCNQCMHRLMSNCGTECLEHYCRMTLGCVCLPFIACAFTIERCCVASRRGNQCCRVSEPIPASNELCCPPYVTIEYGPCTCCLLYGNTSIECCMYNIAPCSFPCGLCYVACCDR